MRITRTGAECNSITSELDLDAAIPIVRAMVGATRPAEAAPGTIRGDYAVAGLRNLIHASDAPETAAAEIALFFRPEELVSYRRDIDQWIYEETQ